MPFEDDNWCFACGRDNPSGLGLVFNYHEDGTVTTSFTAERHFQGFQGAVHGGIVATLLDEALAHAVINRYGFAVTADISLRFRSVTPTESPLEIVGQVANKKLNMVMAKAWLRTAQGKITAEAVGKFILVPEESVERMERVMSRSFRQAGAS